MHLQHMPLDGKIKLRRELGEQLVRRAVLKLDHLLA
jgi:hypothetical protein